MRLKIYSAAAPGLVIILIAAVILIIIGVVFFVTHAKPLFCEYAESEAYSRAAQMISEAANSVFDNELITYDQIVQLKENANGHVTALEANTVVINRIKAKLTTTLENAVNAFTDTDISIPLGSLLHNPIFQGYGPRIHMKFAPMSTLEIEYQDEFTACGINQAKHSLYLDVYVTMTLMSSGFQKDELVHSRILIAETVIVGAVPEYYGGTVFPKTEK